MGEAGHDYLLVVLCLSDTRSISYNNFVRR